MLSFELYTITNLSREKKLLREIGSVEDFLEFHGREDGDYMADLLVDLLGFQVLLDGQSIFDAPLPSAIRYDRVDIQPGMPENRTPLPPPSREVFAGLIHEQASPTNFFVYCCSYWRLFLLAGVHVFNIYGNGWGEDALVVSVDESLNVCGAHLRVDDKSPPEFCSAGWWNAVTPTLLLARTDCAGMDPSGFPWIFQFSDEIYCKELNCGVADWLRGAVSLAKQWWRVVELTEDCVLETGLPDPPFDAVTNTWGFYLDDVSAEIEEALAAL